MDKEITLCQQNQNLRELIIDYAETLKSQAHTLGEHGLDADEFYGSGLFRGVIERIRGQQAATMKQKRKFVATVLDYMLEQDAISDWVSAGEANRHDYQISLNDGRISIIELKGCLDGNNTNIFTRPPQANEFVIWSVCQNPGADPRQNAWSGIHTRLSAEIIDREQLVDGLVIWDSICGTIARKCPKVDNDPNSELLMTLGSYKVTPPCLYLFPSTIPSPRNNPSPNPHNLAEVGIMKAFFDVFGVSDDQLTYVQIEMAYEGVEIVRTTRLMRSGEIVIESHPTPILRV